MSSEVVVRAKIAHNVPGRLRLQLERGADIEDAARRLESRVAKMPGVQGVQVHSSTRSVLINYSPTEIELARLLDEGVAASTIELFEEGVASAGRIIGQTAVGRQVVRAVGTVNVQLEKSTGGVLDLRDAFPMTLFGLGLWRVAQGALQPVPWYNLLYYGYSTFVALHGRRGSAPPVQPDALEILARRYASGEIGRDDYRNMLADLAASANSEVAAVAPLEPETEKAKDPVPTKPAPNKPSNPRRPQGKARG